MRKKTVSKKDRSPAGGGHDKCSSSIIHHYDTASLQEGDFESEKVIYEKACSIQKVIYRHIDCGNLDSGFARVKCKGRGSGYFLT